IDPKYANWTMDDHIAFDVPALVNLVRRKAGAAEVTWVGHSMGGIVAIAHLARYRNPGIGRLVTVGSQVTMSEGKLFGQFLREILAHREQQLFGQLGGRELMDQPKTSVHNMFFNVQDTSPKVYAALTPFAQDVPAAGLLRQYMVLATKGQLLDTRQQYNYAQ